MRPWEPLHLTTALWQQIPPTLVEIADLIPMHDTVREGVEYKMEHPLTSASGDPIPHVIEWNGSLYICDGHHRIEARYRQGASHTVARVLRQT